MPPARTSVSSSASCETAPSTASPVWSAPRTNFSGAGNSCPAWPPRWRTRCDEQHQGQSIEGTPTGAGPRPRRPRGAPGRRLRLVLALDELAVVQAVGFRRGLPHPDGDADRAVPGLRRPDGRGGRREPAAGTPLPSQGAGAGPSRPGRLPARPVHLGTDGRAGADGRSGRGRAGRHLPRLAQCHALRPDGRVVRPRRLLLRLRPPVVPASAGAADGRLDLCGGDRRADASCPRRHEPGARRAGSRGSADRPRAGGSCPDRSCPYPPFGADGPAAARLGMLLVA